MSSTTGRCRLDAGHGWMPTERCCKSLNLPSAINTMTRIYTRTGDQGETGLFGGGRVARSDIRVEAYGSVDELNSVLGWAMTQLGAADVNSLEQVQSDLFIIGAILATPEETRGRKPV